MSAGVKSAVILTSYLIWRTGVHVFFAAFKFGPFSWLARGILTDKHALPRLYKDRSLRRSRREMVYKESGSPPLCLLAASLDIQLPRATETRAAAAKREKSEGAKMTCEFGSPPPPMRMALKTPLLTVVKKHCIASATQAGREGGPRKVYRAGQKSGP